MITECSASGQGSNESVSPSISMKEEILGMHDDEGEETRKAKAVKLPQEPSKEEWEEHMLTHIPPADWCITCLESKSRDDAHSRLAVSRGPPRVQFDIG